MRFNKFFLYSTVSLLAFAGALAEPESPKVSTGTVDNKAILEDETLKQTIKAEAQKCADAFVKNDFETMSSYTHPKVMEMLGGKDKMIELVKKEISRIEDNGIKFLSAKIGEPKDLKKTDGVYYALVPQYLELKVPQGILQQEGFLVAVQTADNRWYFIDTANRELVKRVFPSIASMFEFPEKKKPALIPDRKSEEAP